MPLEVTVIERQPVPAGQRFWDTVGRILPRTVLSTAAKMRQRAPVGKTGKLSRRVDIRVVRVSQGFVQGVEVQFGVGVPYGHLVSAGHRIIARGRTQLSVTTVGISKRTGRQTVRTRLGRNIFARTELKERRLGGAIGVVPGNPFATGTLQEDAGAIVRGIEQGLTNAV